jgi:hypothetical protein
LLKASAMMNIRIPAISTDGKPNEFAVD